MIPHSKKDVCRLRCLLLFVLFGYFLCFYFFIIFFFLAVDCTVLIALCPYKHMPAIRSYFIFFSFFFFLLLAALGHFVLCGRNELMRECRVCDGCAHSMCVCVLSVCGLRGQTVSDSRTCRHYFQQLHKAKVAAECNPLTCFYSSSPKPLLDHSSYPISFAVAASLPLHFDCSLRPALWSWA